MTELEIASVRASWRQIRLNKRNELGNIFYNRLFEQAPHLGHFFVHTKIDQQSIKFSNMLEYIVRKLDDVSLLNEVRQLARKHSHYDLSHDQYVHVQSALFWALENCSTTKWSHSTLEAWTSCFEFLSAVMQQEARFAVRHAKKIS